MNLWKIIFLEIHHLTAWLHLGVDQMNQRTEDQWMSLVQSSKYCIAGFIQQLGFQLEHIPCLTLTQNQTLSWFHWMYITYITFHFSSFFCPNFWRAPLVDTFSKSRFGRCRVLPSTTMAWVPRHNAPSCAFRELPHASWRPRRQRVSQKGPRNAGKFGNFEFRKRGSNFWISIFFFDEKRTPLSILYETTPTCWISQKKNSWSGCSCLSAGGIDMLGYPEVKVPFIKGLK